MRAYLRGPASAILALVIILNMGPATEVLGLPGQEFMPFAVVAALLLWQWFIHLFLPRVEQWLIYSDEDEDQLGRLRNLDEQMLTRKDLESLLEATLATICDNLRVGSSFVVSLLGCASRAGCQHWGAAARTGSAGGHLVRPA